jgi:hypothetical protein
VRAGTSDRSLATSAGRGRARRIAFVVVSVLFLVMHLVLSPLPYAVLGWFLKPGVVSHRIHEICFGLLFVLTAAALIAQLRNPERKLAAMYQVVVPLYLIILSVLVIDRVLDPVVFAFIVLPIILVLLHPARKRLFRPETRPNTLLLAAAAVAALPLIVFAVGQVREGAQAAKLAPQVLEGLPDNASDKQVEDALAAAATTAKELEAIRHYGHWSAMGAFAVSVVALAVVAALGIPGWRLPAWSAAIALIVFGAASLFASGDASSLTKPWAIAAILWGIGFALATEREHRAQPVSDH